jgi:hypothetical protein
MTDVRASQIGADEPVGPESFVELLAAVLS